MSTGYYLTSNWIDLHLDILAVLELFPSGAGCLTAAAAVVHFAQLASNCFRMPPGFRGLMLEAKSDSLMIELPSLLEQVGG